MQLKPAVLIVDDEISLQQSLSLALEADYTPVQALSGMQAYERLLQQSFALVLLDITLMDCNGKELLRAIRARWPQTEVVMITGSHNVNDLLACLADGAFSYLMKPLDLKQLMETVHRATKQWAMKQPAADGELPAPEALSARSWSYVQQAVSDLSRRAIEAGTSTDYPNGLRLPFKRCVQELERQLVLAALTKASFRMNNAADILGIHRNSLRVKMREVGINKAEMKRKWKAAKALGPQTAL